jgi:hypothetical protein
MKTTKTLFLAAVTALTLGAGAAMAQEGGPSMPPPDFWAARVTVIDQVGGGTIQSGSSDVSTLRGDVPAHYDYGDLADPG